MTPYQEAQLDALHETALACLNVPYVWGGNNPLTGFDCSGFFLWCYTAAGLWTLGDASAQVIYNNLRNTNAVLPSTNPATLGCALFFGGSLTNISHIAMALDAYFMIEAGGSGSVCKTPTDAAKVGACVRIRPIVNRRDLVAKISPFPSPPK